MREEFQFRGSGGQGILSMGLVLAYAALRDGLEVSWIPSYGAERRGGPSFCAVTVSDKPVDCPVTMSPTVLFVMDERAVRAYVPRLDSKASLVYNSNMITSKPEFVGRLVPVEANRIAADVGMAPAVNMAALGAVIGVKNVVTPGSIEKALLDVLGERKAKVIPANFRAFEAGFKSVTLHAVS